IVHIFFYFFFSSRRRHTRSKRDWSSDVCSSDLDVVNLAQKHAACDAPVDGALLVESEVDARRVLQQSKNFGHRAIRGRYGFRFRSEERRVGKECRFRWWAEQ